MLNVSSEYSFKDRKDKKCKIILWYNTNSLYLYCTSQVMLCWKEEHVRVKAITSAYNIKEFTKYFLTWGLFGFVQVDIEVPKKLYENFKKVAPLFVLDGMTEVPEHTKSIKKPQVARQIKVQGKLRVWWTARRSYFTHFWWNGT